MRTKSATDRTMGLAVEYQSTDQQFMVRFLKGNASTRELGAAIKTGRLGRAQADKLTPVQIKWLVVIRTMLTEPQPQSPE